MVAEEAAVAAEEEAVVVVVVVAEEEAVVVVAEEAAVADDAPPPPHLLQELATAFAPPIVVPQIVFLVPYRDRVQQRAFFQRHMTGTVLADMPEGMHQIWFVHQCDSRRFNRGAMKNIGVRIAQDVYPDHWRGITFVFNDVDTMPFTAGFFDYGTTHGVVKHFFGFAFALGGIVSITGHDFDRVNGFPNLWAWGYEDNALQDRCASAPRMTVDRSVFYPIMDKNVMQFPDGNTRALNRTEYDRYALRQVTDGLYDVFDIQYHEMAGGGAMPAEDYFDLEQQLLPGVRQFQVTAFHTLVPEPATADEELDFSKGVHPFAGRLQQSSQQQQQQQHPLRTLFNNIMFAKK